LSDSDSVECEVNRGFNGSTFQLWPEDALWLTWTKQQVTYAPDLSLAFPLNCLVPSVYRRVLITGKGGVYMQGLTGKPSPQFIEVSMLLSLEPPAWELDYCVNHLADTIIMEQGDSF
jgi:hypothetical protein